MTRKHLSKSKVSFVDVDVAVSFVVVAVVVAVVVVRRELSMSIQIPGGSEEGPPVVASAVAVGSVVSILLELFVFASSI